MPRNEQLWEWSQNMGLVRNAAGGIAMPATAIPDGLVYDCQNVDIQDEGLIKRRTVVSQFSGTGGAAPSVGVRYLFTQTTASAVYLWAFQSDGAAAMTATRWDASAWTAITLSDTVATLAQPHCVQYNGKVFMAYNSNVNRLHVYDGTSVRRVGIGEVAAPTVANTGAGAYAATLRYYKAQMGIVTNPVISVPNVVNAVAVSELSASVSFTPSGAGTAARITKPATVDSATHWRVFASADNVTFYELSGWTVVATTFLDDDDAPSTYSSGVVSPVPGLNIPPPSAKYLATDGTRLVMAGAWETSAGSGETTPATARVWFTRPLGATDKGDDESITSTADSRYWIDIDDPRGSGITALHQIGGVVYVFFKESIWRLLATGQSDTPYRSEQVSTSAGAVSQYATCVGQMPGSTEDAIYFVSPAGFYRVSAYGSLEWLGRDILPRNASSYTTGLTLAYDPLRRDIWLFIPATTVTQFILNVDRFGRRGSEPHGGARRFAGGFSYGFGTSFDSNMVLAGGTSTAILDKLADGGLSGDTFTASVTSRAFMVPGHKITVEEPLVQISSGGVYGTTLTVTYTDPYSINQTRTSAVTYTTPVAEGADGVFRIQGLVLADANAVRVTIASTEGQIERAWIPYKVQEPL